MPNFRPCLPLLAAVVFAACSPNLSSEGPAATTEPTDTLAVSPTAAPGRSEPTTRDLLLWLPPRFDPAAEGEAAQLLQSQLEAFEAEHPGVTVQTRIKGETGPGGLLETLSAAKTVAPDVLPDVIALHPAALTSATLKGLIQPLDDVTARPTEDGWFPYAVLAAEIDGGFYGLPFASDAQVFAYRTGVYSSPPRSWSLVLDTNQPFLFPAGDQEALFTLIQYQSLGGNLTGPSGRPALDPTALSRVLAFYGSARSSRLLSEDALSVTTAEQSWQAFLEGRAAGSVAPLSSFLNRPNSTFLSASPLPNRDGDGVSIAYTWSWALVATDPERQQLAADLIQMLLQPDFLGPWSEALGLLPPSTVALDNWQEGADASVVALLAPTLQPRPSEETLATFGPHLKEAVSSVLSGGMSPDEAALQAAQSVQSP